MNAVWELYAKKENKPLWQLIADFTPEEFVAATPFRCELASRLGQHCLRR